MQKIHIFQNGKFLNTLSRPSVCLTIVVIKNIHFAGHSVDVYMLHSEGVLQFLVYIEQNLGILYTATNNNSENYILQTYFHVHFHNFSSALNVMKLTKLHVAFKNNEIRNSMFCTGNGVHNVNKQLTKTLKRIQVQYNNCQKYVFSLVLKKNLRKILNHVQNCTKQSNMQQFMCDHCINNFPFVYAL